MKVGKNDNLVVVELEKEGEKIGLSLPNTLNSPSVVVVKWTPCGVTIVADGGEIQLQTEPGQMPFSADLVDMFLHKGD